MTVTFSGRRRSRRSSPSFVAPKKVPDFCIHKSTDQAFVRLNGRMIYLGRHDDPAAKMKYDRMIAEWLGAGRQVAQPGAEITITELAARYWTHTREYYVNSAGEPTPEQWHVKTALGLMRELYGDRPACEFGPKALMAVRTLMIAREWKRITVNQMVGRIKRMFRWATEQELVPGSVYHAIEAVAGLRRGRCDVEDGKPVRPVAQELIEAVKPFVARQVWAMIQMQLLTGARPGEICIMKPKDVDRTGKVWVYHPSEHKTAYRGYDRNIYIGPQAQIVLSPYLLRGPNEYCFSPAEADGERRADLHAGRVIPEHLGNNLGTNRKDHPEKKPGPCYTVNSYRRAIQNACDSAFPAPPPLCRGEGELAKEHPHRLTPEQKEQLKAWRKAHRWHPHQLRHNAGTYLRKEFGLDTARIILGHRSASVTLIYAEADKDKAIDVIQKVG